MNSVTRLNRFAPAAVLAAVLLGSTAGPLGVSAEPASQVQLDSPEDRWRIAEESARRLAERLRGWPVGYEFHRPRPEYPGGPLQRLFPWEFLGSPFVPVVPSPEFRFYGIAPSPRDFYYGDSVQHAAQPLAFRVNYREAEPYLLLGYGPAVLDLWAAYLGRSTTELPRSPGTPEEYTQAIAAWLRDAGFLVQGAMPPGARY